LRLGTERSDAQRRACRRARRSRGVPATGAAAVELAARVARARRCLYDLYAELTWFAEGPAHARDALRAGLSWPDVGHVTSLARALAEEDGFIEWLRFNRLTRRLARAA